MQLGLSHNEIKKFEKEDDPLSVLISYWIDGNARNGVPRNWESVVEALRSRQVDESGLARRIEEKYCSVKAKKSGSKCPYE